MATFHDLTTAQFKRALQIREQIEKLQAKLDALLGGTTPKARLGDHAARSTQAAANRGKTGAAPAWRWAHVRSPLDTLMDAAPENKGAPGAEGRARRPAAWKKSAPGPNASAPRPKRREQIE